MLDDQQIAQIIAIMDEIRAETDSLQKPEIDTSSIQKGFLLSRNAIKQPQYVEMTPIFKNALKYYGWPEGKRLQVDDPQTEAEKQLNLIIEAKLNTLIGTRADKYDLTLPIDSPKHYIVDCWRNFKANMRDIQPGQEKQRLESFAVYTKPARDVGVRELLVKSPEFAKAVEMLLEILPRVKAEDNITEISAAFMRKHTNTCYPLFMNDRTTVPGSTLTAGEETRRIAEEIWKSDDWYDKTKQFLVWTALARNQRGKGRALIASSRVLNLILNLIEAPEISQLKDKCPAFAGYNNDEELKRVLIRMCEDCKRDNLWATNWDQSSYDQHVSRDLIELIGALGVLKCSGSRSEQLVKLRAVSCCKGWLINGHSNSIVEIFGRIFSGGLDTNAGGGKINIIISTFCCMVCDPKYSSIWYKHKHPMLVMGDDNLQAHRKDVTHDSYVKAMSSIGFDVNPLKGEEGIFFLQRRLIKENEQYIMVTPVTRVIKSCLFKEHSSSLGPYGWTAAILMVLSQLLEYPKALDVAVSVLYPYDRMKLGSEMTAAQLVEGIQMEDAEALANKKGRKNVKSRGNISDAAARRRVMSTIRVLQDADPLKSRIFTADGESLNVNYFDTIIAAVRDSVRRTGVKTLVNTTGKLDGRSVLGGETQDDIEI